MRGLFEHASFSANDEVRIDRTEKEGKLKPEYELAFKL